MNKIKILYIECHGWVFCLFSFETVLCILDWPQIHYVAEDDLEFPILLEWWDYRCVHHHLCSLVIKLKCKLCKYSTN